MNQLPMFSIARASAEREFLSHRLNRFLYGHAALVVAAGFLLLGLVGALWLRRTAARADSEDAAARSAQG